MAKFIVENDIVIRDIGSCHASEKHFSPLNPYSMKDNYHFHAGSFEFKLFLLVEFNRYWSRAYIT